MLLIITVGFGILHDVLYDMGIMKPPLVLLYTGCVSFYFQDIGLLWQIMCYYIGSINQTKLATVTFNVTAN